MAESNLTSYGAGSYRRELERLHAALYSLHHDIYQGACKRIKDALIVLHGIETSNADLRPVCKSYISEFEDLRDGLEKIGRDAASFRSKLIHENGCEGTCHD